MGVLARIEARNLTSGLLHPEPWLFEAFGGQQTATGLVVSEESAMRQSAVFACVRTLAEDVGSLPFILYRRDGEGGRERADKHPLYEMLRYQPNPEIDAFKFYELVVAHVALGGRFFAEIETASGRPRALWPIHPRRVQADRDDRGNRIWRVTVDGEQVVLRDDEMFHVQGFGTDDQGLGMSVVAAARQAIGLAQAAEEYGARFYGNNAVPGGAIKYPKALSETSIARLRQSFEAKHRGLSNAHRVALLEDGMEWVQIGITPEDSQFLELRKYQTVDIARLFRIPPHKIGEVERSTSWGTGIEQQEIGYVINSLRPWLRRIEFGVRRKLIPHELRRSLYGEFLMEEHFRGDSPARAAFYKELLALGAMSPNDIARRENLEPVEGGDRRYISIQVVPLDSIGTDPENPGETAANPPENAGNGDERASFREFAEEIKAVGQRLDAVVEAIPARVVEGVIPIMRDAVEPLGRDVTELSRQSAEWREETLAGQRALAEKVDAVEASAREAVAELGGAIVPVIEAAGAAAEMREEERAKQAEEHHRAVLGKLDAAAIAELATREDVSLIGETLGMEVRALREAHDSGLAEIRGSAEAEAVERRAGEERLSAEIREARPPEPDLSAVTEGLSEVRETIAQVGEVARGRPDGELHARVLAAQRGLWTDAMGRMVRKEAAAARRAAKKPAEFRMWCVRWYDDHLAHVAEAAAAVVGLHLAYAGSDADPAEEAVRIAKEHVKESKRQLLDLEDRVPPEKLAEVIDHCVTKWERERPAQIADGIMKEEVRHVLG